MHVNVPQFIDIEDKIAFGLTAKQLLWMGGMGATLLVLYNIFERQAFYTVGIFVILIFGCLAFWKPQGVTLLSFLGFTLQYFMKPRNYIWRRMFHAGDLSTQKAAHKNLMAQNIHKIDPRKAPSQDQLRKIAWTLDTKK